ncbi:MAG: NADH:flavin oxidoreductase [Gammaproteobacteria bacterium]|nr:NADH:flavin oxidoreductase [Gammaproteobacteria bacterium]MBT8151581.1 NADH:flavin oxidoreductase [Gammaproteobacteria bacterium]NND39603.1 NADH:flavin oxidoreductase [Pseudomonadales bacterium]NNM11508.1 NADH:flavin oxidoreductase [Pseudomonadales bacterium]
MSEHLDRAFSPASLGQLPLKNRIIKAATYEGKTPDGVPGEVLKEFHKSIVAGGVAMTTIGYCTTEADGRINDQMMWLHEGVRPQLTSMIDELKTLSPGVKVSGQLAHCGNFSKNRKMQRLKRPLGPSRAFNMLGAPSGLPFAGAMTLADIDHFVQTYVDSARFMQSVGFDAAEVHFGHGYGLSQFISPRTNKRDDIYGGSLQNRMRLPMRVLEAVKNAVGNDFPILGKMNMTDGVKDGVHLAEAIEIASMLDKGGIDALICSGGTSSFNPMVYFRGESLVTGMIEQETNPIAKLGLRIIGSKLFREYPYYENYFLEDAKKVRERVDCQMVYIGGCTELDSLEKVMQEGFDFVQLGRPLIKDPDYVKNAKANPNYKNGCIHCNRCATMIEAPGGVRCPLNDPQSPPLLATT